MCESKSFDEHPRSHQVRTKKKNKIKIDIISNLRDNEHVVHLL
jgi:hypothetical protein